MTEQSQGEGGFTPEQETSFTPSWVMEKAEEYDEYHSQIQLLARQLHRTPPTMLTPELLSNQYSMLLQKVLNQEIPEADACTLMAKIGVKHEELVGMARVSREKKRPVEPGSGDTLTEAIKDLSFGVKDLRKLLEEEGQLRPALTKEQVEQMSTPDVTGSYSQQTEVLRKAFGRLPSQEENHRWIDVELSQEFYTRFAPNQEPYFYSESSSREREKWDARWRLARAAFYKKIYGAMPDKLAENQDLIELTTEQMKLLYEIEGVKEAMNWYVGLIVNKNPVSLYGEQKTIYDCENGRDFLRVRAQLRKYLVKTVFRGEPRNTPKEKQAFLMKLKSADAVAWNFVFCSNLVESMDSRYSDIKHPGRCSGGRHAKLPPALCSDDLRAVFHPQEKFENKCAQLLEWGAFGKWGITQMSRIVNESGLPLKEISFRFMPATREDQYWQGNITGQKDEEGKKIIDVLVPECYPGTVLTSFLEKCKDRGEEESGTPILERILMRKDINWGEIGGDPWKTSYQTVQMRKAVTVFELFMGRMKTEEGWTIPVLDAFRRLGLAKDKNYHNIKVWGYYATEGGVKRPDYRNITPPMGPIDVWSRQRNLSQPRIGYLDRGENLMIKL